MGYCIDIYDICIHIPKENIEKAVLDLNLIDKSQLSTVPEVRYTQCDQAFFEYFEDECDLCLDETDIEVSVTGLLDSKFTEDMREGIETIGKYAKNPTDKNHNFIVFVGEDLAIFRYVWVEDPKTKEIRAVVEVGEITFPK